MAGAFESLITGGQALLEGALDSPAFTWAGFTIPCVPNTLRRGDTVIIGGTEVRVRLTLIARTEAIEQAAGASRPNVGQKLTHRGTTYRIGATRNPAPGATLELDLIDPNEL